MMHDIVTNFSMYWPVLLVTKVWESWAAQRIAGDTWARFGGIWTLQWQRDSVLWSVLQNWWWVGSVCSMYNPKWCLLHPNFQCSLISSLLFNLQPYILCKLLKNIHKHVMHNIILPHNATFQWLCLFTNVESVVHA